MLVFEMSSTNLLVACVDPVRRVSIIKNKYRMTGRKNGKSPSIVKEIMGNYAHHNYAQFTTI